jgi:dTDP-4-dehydrorhamnose reductase
MQILLFGGNGQLGWELQRSLAPLGKVHILDHPQVDFMQPESLREIVEGIRPDVIVNAAAYTAVDRAESEIEATFLINHQAVDVLAREAFKRHIPLIHYSTDYVFDGKKRGAYFETDKPNPLNVYGRSKLKGEEAVSKSGCVGVVLRTSWVYSLRGGGFVTKVLTWARENEMLRIVDDQISGPTSARMLAETTSLMLAKAGKNPYDYLAERAGLYHLAGDGVCSRYEWAKVILALDPRKQAHSTPHGAHRKCQLIPAKSTDFLTSARRPLETVLNCDRFENVFGLRLPPWQDALRMMMEED